MNTVQPNDLLTFAPGDATKVPLADESFDVVAWQTVLMHMTRPMDALREMLRVLRRGGLLVCVEPNNLWNHLAFTSLTVDEPIEMVVRRFEFWLRDQRGKMTAGEGDHSIGDLLPGCFAQLGSTDISAFESDRAAPLFPPYDTAEQQAVLKQEQHWKTSDTGPWDRAELRRQVLNGGGSKAFFERVFAELTEKVAQEQKGIAAGTFHAAFGGVNCLVSARKP